MASRLPLQPFAFIPPDMRRQVAPRLRIVRAPRGRTLLATGTRSPDVLCLLEGVARIVLHSRNGREISVRDLEPGEVFGELSALDGEPRSATVVAVTPVRIAVMARSDFLACLEASPAAALWLARRLGAEVRRLTERVFELSALSATARIHCELLRLARLVAPDTVVSPAPTHEELAARVSTTREAVTRELRRLTVLGAIATRPRRIEFLDLRKLDLMAGEAAE